MTFFESSPRFSLLLEHDLFRKPVPSPDQVRARLFRDHALETEAWPPEGVAPEVAAEAPGLERRGVPADEQAGPLAHDLLAHVIERAPRPGGVAPPGRLLLLAARLVGLPLNRFLDRLVDRFLHRLLDWRVDGARCELVVRTGVGGARLLGRRLDRRGGRDPARRRREAPGRRGFRPRRTAWRSARRRIRRRSSRSATTTPAAPARRWTNGTRRSGCG